MQRVYGAWLYIEAADKTFAHCGGLRIRKDDQILFFDIYQQEERLDSSLDTIVSV